MKIASLLALFFSLLLPPLTGAKHPCPSSETALPFQVAEFYENCNYVCSYSTRNERMKLLESLHRGELSLEDKSERLADVLTRMRKILDHALIIDPEMALKKKGSSPIRRNLFFRTERIEVQTFRKTGDKLSVKLTVLELEPEEVLRFISSYNQEVLKDRAPLVPERLQKSSSKTLKKTKYHDWTLLDGKWMRSDGSYLLLKR